MKNGVLGGLLLAVMIIAGCTAVEDKIQEQGLQTNIERLTKTCAVVLNRPSYRILWHKGLELDQGCCRFTATAEDIASLAKGLSLVPVEGETLEARRVRSEVQQIGMAFEDPEIRLFIDRQKLSAYYTDDWKELKGVFRYFLLFYAPSSGDALIVVGSSFG